MKLNFRKNSLISVAVLVCFNVHSLNLLNTDFLLSIPIDLKSLNFVDSSEHGLAACSTVAYEDHAIVTYNFHDYEMNQTREGTFRLDYDSFPNINNANTFDCQLPAYSNSPQPYSADPTDYLSNHLKDSALDQRRQDMQDNHAVLIQEQKHLSLDKIFTCEDFEIILSSPNIRSFFQQLAYSLTYQYQEKSCTLSREKTLTEMQAKIHFVDAILSGKVTELLKQINLADLATAENSFSELKQLWPWERKHSFLNSKLNPHEKDFLTQLRVNAISMAERDLIARPDYMAKYADKKSVKTIESHANKCLFLQQEGNRSELCRQAKQLRKQVTKNGKKEILATNISLAITLKTLHEPITTTLYTIAYAPSLEEAHHALQDLEIKIARQAQQNNIVLTSETQKLLIEQYGFDIREAAHECYRSRTDYVRTFENRTSFSDPVNHALYNIQHKNLHMAHAELVQLKQQIAQGLAEQNIIDPTEQKEFIIKDFGVDVLTLAQSTYEERPDFLNLIKLFTPLDVQGSTAQILKTSNSYESVAEQMQDVAEQVFTNVKLCGLENVSELEDGIFQSLQVIRNPSNNVEFIFHASVVDHLLTDMQSQADAIATATPTTWQETSELFKVAITEFIHGANPIELVKDTGYLFLGAGYVFAKAVDRAIEEIRDPIGTTKEYCAFVSQTCHYITDVARFTSDTIYGTSFLPKDVYEKRVDIFSKTLEVMDNAFTPKNIVAATFRTVGSFAGSAGVRNVTGCLKQMGVFTRISDEAKVLIQPIIDAIKKSPAFVTAEGVVLKMSDGLKDKGLSKSGNRIMQENGKASPMKNAGPKSINPKNKPLTEGLPKSGGHIMRENGKAFEDFLVKKLGGGGSFHAGGREFDGAIGNIWYEAKSGAYWEGLLASEAKLNKFKSTTCHCSKIANDHGALFEIHSNNPIPQNIKDWLTKKQIPFTEWL